MNQSAVSVLYPSPLSGSVASVELTSGLQTMLERGLVMAEEALVFREHARQTAPVPIPETYLDLTGWECSTNSFHLEDVVPVEVGLSETGEPLIDETGQILMLRQGLAFAVEITRLAHDLRRPVAVRFIVSANNTNGTFRFHRVRVGESWLATDLDSYRLEKLIVVESTVAIPTPNFPPE